MYSYLVNAWWTTRTSVGPKRYGSLCLPSKKNPLELIVNASGYGMGAAISHVNGVNVQTIACSPNMNCC